MEKNNNTDKKKENQMAKTQTISVREFAIARGCSLKWIRDLLYAKRLPGAHKIGRQWRIPRSALESYNQRFASLGLGGSGRTENKVNK